MMSLDALPLTRAVLEAGVVEGLHPGAQIYVSLHGNVIVDDAVGIARPGVSMTRDSLTLWMSAGKPVTAVAILQLVERGLIALDTPVVDLIAEFGANGKAAITLRHLLTHTGGFRGPLNNFTPGTWDEILARVYALKQEPGWVPGEKAGYHVGSSWFVLGELVRRLDGRPIDAYVREEIFAKLGEPDASIGLSAERFDRGGHALMFVTEKSPMTNDWPGNTREANALPRPGANARGPIRALGKMYEAFLHSLPPVFGGEGWGEGAVDRVVRDALAGKAHTPLPVPSLPGTHSLRSVRAAEREFVMLLSRTLARALSSRQRLAMLDHTFKQTLDWGLGMMIDSKQYAGEHQYGFGTHASADTFGHSGNQSSCAFADPMHGLVVAWTCNGMPGEARHQARASAINRAIYEDLHLAPQEPRATVL